MNRGQRREPGRAGLAPASRPDDDGPMTSSPGNEPRPAAGDPRTPGGATGHHRDPGRIAAPAARAEALTKRYGRGDAAVTALDGIDVSFAAGEFTAIMGPSGSGKSTLLHCMAGLDSATSGRAWIGDREITGLGDAGLTALRRDHLGFVFQSFNLVPTLTAKENITLPLDIAGRKVDQAWFGDIVRRLGLDGRLRHRPAQLSGGQQQRVACARALLGRPAVVFGDEPTGNLDSNSSAEVLDIFRTAVDDLGQTVVIVTHDPAAAARADRVVFLADGRIDGELRDPGVDAILHRMAGIGGL